MLPAQRAELFMAIEQERARRVLSVERLCLEAGVSKPHYDRLVRVQGAKTTARFVTAVLRGLKSARLDAATARPPDELAFLRGAYAGCLAAAAKAYNTDVKMVELLLGRPGEFPGDAAWRLASHVRTVALYLAATELQIEGRGLAALVGVSPAAVSYALNRVELWRDEKTFDALVEQAAEQVRGKP